MAGGGMRGRGNGACVAGGGAFVAGSILAPPPNRMTDRCKNITLPQLRCGR